MHSIVDTGTSDGTALIVVGADGRPRIGGVADARLRGVVLGAWVCVAQTARRWCCLRTSADGRRQRR